MVPQGEWLVLDTFDHDLRGFVTVNMSTVVLAQVQRNVDGEDLVAGVAAPAPASPFAQLPD